MVLIPIDRELLNKCLAHDEDAWSAFIDRFAGLVTRVVSSTADRRSISLSATDREDLVSEVFVELLTGEMAPLRKFQGKSSLATYLAVIARRVVVRRLLVRAGITPIAPMTHDLPSNTPTVEDRIANQQQVEHMLQGLVPAEAQVVRLYHLEGKSYREISRVVGMPENTIGPLLSRARTRLRAQPH
ncbi:RNA polymerase sigma factor [Botrimarina hoheduenensis]|uniref:RNA polymerase sigma factor n=1 Tax=Botrimarina hoheduenensis TaxID=2528000 RepID=A0A5C5VY34_9BACT|nr:sigma-70 family RNA polymerase sigma factor [Botrimarina hoheduenensis]TWT42915.1 RNA polymerase sigma factor [Botrimarina hoheduenensis]